MVGKADFFSAQLSAKLSGYLDAYAKEHQLSAKEIAKFYNEYIFSYNEDIQAFLETGKYPPFLDSNRIPPSRKAYSIILILSTLLTRHRFRIMQLVEEKTPKIKNGLFIGCGPGLELELLRGKFEHMIAYDLSLDPFLSSQHPQVEFREALFTGQKEKEFDCVFLIELLEHLTDPYQLLSDCSQVLQRGGEVHLTTATNLPQWDHYYNFEPDHVEFEQKIQDLGFTLHFKEIISHAYLVTDLGSKNHYYILKKK